MRRLIRRCDPPQAGFQTKTDLAKNSEILDSQISCKRPIQAKNGSNLYSVRLSLLYTKRLTTVKIIKYRPFLFITHLKC